MWNDWFFYSRGQRRAIIFLLLVLILLICILASENIGNNRTEIAIEPLKIADSLYVRIDNDKRNRYNYRRYKDKEPVYKKNKKQSSDFSYEHKKEEKKEIKKYPKQEKFNAGIIIDVNTADTSILKKIPGVGSVISRNIVNYRNRLGGFYNTAQLLEVQYVDSTLLKWFEVKSDVFRKIRINKAGLDELRSHPYMDFYKARAIIDFRRKRGFIDGMSQISMFEEFSEEDIDKLSHYFSFE
ncbi:helix-hairpin-helix domain-containing protein [Bacteroides caecigallinarum]|uniref:helix-hairpin-helix domain-containing protein n=1 Tax=Bacteroides caecigallinarum TaxID=1411144 RepID=UPI001F401B05|nr:helix-hairpin-helix domain-containing protein [Bacteroides caecigallinarum]MCF2736999.1 helix-hairpin-helix domain-containing protein [Bacteroides caecigallinarum]